MGEISIDLRCQSATGNNNLLMLEENLLHILKPILNILIILLIVKVVQKEQTQHGHFTLHCKHLGAITQRIIS